MFFRAASCLFFAVLSVPAALAAEPDNPLQALVRVRVAEVRQTEMASFATASGVVEPFRRATVAAEASGRVVERLVEPGQSVNAGQNMITLDAELAQIARRQAAARKRTAQVNLSEARSELARGQNLRQRQFISEDTLETLRFAVQRAEAGLREAEAALMSAERTLRDATVRAPFDGTAEVVHAQVGDFLNPGMPVVSLVDFSRARVRAGLTAREAAEVVAGSAATVSLEALGSVRLEGAVRSVARISDPTSGTYAAEIWIDNAENRLREGMLANVRVDFVTPTTSVAVPSISVFRRDGTMKVFVVEDDVSRLRTIETGRSSGALVEVLSGLKLGERVVVDGQFALRDGAKVNVLER